MGRIKLEISQIYVFDAMTVIFTYSVSLLLLVWEIDNVPSGSDSICNMNYSIIFFHHPSNDAQ